MLPKMTDFNAVEREISVVEPEVEVEVEVDATVENKALQTVADENKKAITEIGLSDVKVSLDQSKSYAEQAEDVAELQATISAVSDQATAKEMTDLKATQILDHQKKKVAEATEDLIKKRTDIQKAERDSYEGILETFGFFRHLPSWLMKAIVYMLTPFFLVIGFLIGIPCGFVKILIENIEGIVVKYERTDDKTKPRIRVTVIIILVLAIASAICLTTLKCLNII